MIVRVPAPLVQQRYTDLAAQLLAPVKGRRPLDPSRVEWIFDYAPTVFAGCLANMLGRKQASDSYYALTEDEQVKDFEQHCTVHLVARQGQRVRRSEPLTTVPPEVLDAHRWSVQMEAEWREKSGRSGTPASSRASRATLEMALVI